MRRQENKIPILTENIHTKELQNSMVITQIRIKPKHSCISPNSLNPTNYETCNKPPS